jgi:acyl transferase domain-containing protein
MATKSIDLRDEPGSILAGVSSFGITGTNAHIVLQEAEQQATMRQDVGHPLVLPISARSPEALHELLCAYLKDVRGQVQKWSIHDLCYTASVRRDHHEFRTAIVCADSRELEERLAAAVDDDEASEGVFRVDQVPSGSRLFLLHRGRVRNGWGWRENSMKLRLYSVRHLKNAIGRSPPRQDGR